MALGILVMVIRNGSTEASSFWKLFHGKEFPVPEEDL